MVGDGGKRALWRKGNIHFGLRSHTTKEVELQPSERLRSLHNEMKAFPSVIEGLKRFGVTKPATAPQDSCCSDIGVVGANGKHRGPGIIARSCQVKQLGDLCVRRAKVMGRCSYHSLACSLFAAAFTCVMCACSLYDSRSSPSV
jgi:hypothetical protein